jgi:hypothetical protein
MRVAAMSQGVNEVIFLVEEDPECGFTARALGPAIFTEAETVEGIHAAVRDAPGCHFDNEVENPKIVRMHSVKDRVIANAVTCA